MADKDKLASVENCLVQRYNERGYLLEDEVIDSCVDYDLDLAEIDAVCDRLLKRNIIFRDTESDTLSDSEDKDVYDRSHTDYDKLYEVIINEYPFCETMVNQIKKIIPPQHKEWFTLIKEAQDGNIFARDRIILMYLRTLLKQAYDFSKAYYCDFEDCFQNAVIGLINAIEKYDTTSPDSFASYFPLWARQVMYRDCEIKGTIFRYPVHYKDRILAAINGFDDMGAKLDDVANTDQEIIEKCTEVDCYDNVYGEIELDFGQKYRDEFIKLANGKFDCNHILPYLPYYDVLANEVDIEENIINEVNASSVRKALDTCLKEREKNVIEMRYGFDDGISKTLEEIGKFYGITRERVRQIENSAMRKLIYHFKRIK